MTGPPTRFRSKNARPVQHSWCPAWSRSFTGRRTEAVSCQLERDHDGLHHAALDRKYTIVTVTWSDDNRPTHRIKTKELAPS
jgi:hypothetical protein